MTVDFILVEKGKRLLTVVTNSSPLKSFEINLGENPVGPKQVEGDGKTPEGHYTIDGKNPKSSFYLNLGISYPELKDKKHAASLNAEAGGLIKIHGEPNNPSLIPNYPSKDWTKGCIALKNDDMQELYELIEIGTPIEIRP